MNERSMQALYELLSLTDLEGDREEAAQEMMRQCGSLRGLMEAGKQQLKEIPGMTEETALLLSLLLPLYRRCQQEENEQHPFLKTLDERKQYATRLLRGLRAEQCWLIGLDETDQVVSSQCVSKGTIASVSVYPRAVMGACMRMNCVRVMMCHNHPGGEAVPSVEDLNSTWLNQQLLYYIGVVLVDHVIVSDRGVYSFAEHDGLMNPEKIAEKSNERSCEQWRQLLQRKQDRKTMISEFPPD